MADAPKTYASLRSAVRKVLNAVEEDAGPARMARYHRTGEMIHAHVLLNEERADYGKEVLQRLSEDLGRGERRLYEMVDVYRAYPILRTSAKLRWSHYVALASVKDEQLRAAYEAAAARRSWSFRTLREQIGQGVFEDEEGKLAEGWDRVEPPEPRRGRPYTYRVKELSGRRVVLDLGMGMTFSPDIADTSGLAVGDVVATKPLPLPGPPRDGEGDFGLSVYRVEAGDPGNLYTYKAEVIRVVDGDTLWMKVDFGFRLAQPWKVRLRGVDAPELADLEGQSAKRWLEDRLEGQPFVVITTSKVGKFGRYIADLFVAEREAGSAKRRMSVGGVAERGVYLNGEMVREGVAVVV